MTLLIYFHNENFFSIRQVNAKWQNSRPITHSSGKPIVDEVSVCVRAFEQIPK